MNKKQTIVRLSEETSFSVAEIADVVGSSVSYVENVRSREGAGRQAVLKRNKVWWRSRQRPLLSQRQLARRCGVSQQRVSQMVQTPRDVILSSMMVLPSAIPPKAFYEAVSSACGGFPARTQGSDPFFDVVAFRVAFRDGQDKAPWKRSLNLVPRDELQSMLLEVQKNIPWFYHQRNYPQAHQHKHNVVRSVAFRHFVEPEMFRLFCTARHTRWTEGFNAWLFEQTGDHQFLMNVREPDPALAA